MGLSFDSVLTQGQSHDFSFSIPDDGALIGVGLLLATSDNKTNITWTFVGNNQVASQESGSNSATGPSNTKGSTPFGGGVGSAAVTEVSKGMVMVMGFSMVAVQILHL